MQYALIGDGGMVVNIIWLEPKNINSFPFAVPLSKIPTTIGDRYHDNAFWRDGIKLIPPLEAAQATIEVIDSALVELEYQNALLELGI